MLKNHTVNHKLENTFNWFRAEQHIIEGTCSCGDCGTTKTSIKVGDTVEAPLRGMFIKTADGASIRVKEFEIYQLPKKV